MKTMLLPTPNSDVVARIMRASAALVFAGLIVTSDAADFYKTNNADDLNLATSWTNGAAPGSSDVAVWDITVDGTVLQNLLLGADASWGGIRILDALAGVTIMPGNTLTLGASGIDTTAGIFPLVLSNAVTIGAPQNWNLTTAVDMRGVFSGTAGNAITNIGIGQINVYGANNAFVDGIVVNAGIVNVVAGSSMPITLNGGQFTVSAALGNPVRATPGGGVIRNTANRTLSGAFSGNGIITVYVTGAGTSLSVNGDLSGLSGTIVHGPLSTGSIRANSGAFVGNGNVYWDLGPTGGFTRSSSAATISFGALAGGVGSRMFGNNTIVYMIGGLNTNSTFSGNLAEGTIVKVGTGTWTLDGTNNYAGSTTISNGVLQIGSGGESGKLGTGTVTNYASLVFNRGGTQTFPNLIAGPGNITNIGPGKVQLTGANTYSGQTIITAGTLAVGSASLVTSDYVVGNSATLGAVVTSAGATVSEGNVTFGTGCSYEFDMGTFGNPTVPVATNTGTITLSGGNVTVNILGTNFSTGTVKLLTYAGRSGGGSFVLGTLPPNILSATLTDDTVGKEVRLNITSVVVPPDLTIAYVGDANGAWDLTNNIWKELLTSQVTNFYSGAPVRFDDSATGTTDINLTTALTPASVIVSNVTKTYKYFGAGDLTGTTPLIKQGSGTLIISNANTYSGLTAIQAGTVRIEGEVGAIGAGGVTNNGALVIDKTAATNALPTPNTLTFFGQVTGTGSLTYLGFDETNSILEVEVGTADGNPYSGGTTISNGFARLNANPVTDSTRAAAKSTGLGSGTVNFLGTSTVELEDYGVGNNGAQSGTFAPALNVPAGQTGTFRTGGRMTVSSALTGSGTLNLAVSYIRCVISGNFSAFTGQLNVTPSPNLTGNQYQIGNAAGLPLAKVHLTAGVTMGGQVPLGTGSVVPIGELSMDAGSFVNTVGENPNTAIFSVGGLNTSNSLAGNLGGPHSWVKVGTGTLTLSGTNDYTGNTTVSNGVIELIGETGISNSATISVASPGILDVSSRTDGTLWLGAGANSQTLQGDGTVRGSVSVGSLGTVSPGFSIGTLTVTNALTLGGTVSMELNRTNGSATNDMLVALAITGGGTLRVTNVGPALVVGDSFKLFNLAVSGFASVELPVTDSTGTTYTWNDTLAANGTISVATATPAVNTTPTNITFSLSGTTLNLTWPGDHLGWTLQTNAVGLANTNSWFPYPGSSGVTNLALTVDRQKTNVFFRLVYP